jgi:hypothetical protein
MEGLDGLGDDLKVKSGETCGARDGVERRRGLLLCNWWIKRSSTR